MCRLDMPQGARILNVGRKPGDDNPHIWALVDPSHITETRVFVAVDTGKDIPAARELVYLGINVADNGIVKHIFEIRGEIQCDC